MAITPTGVSGTDLSTIKKGSLQNYMDFAKQLMPAREKRDPWLTAFEFFVNMAAESSKPGATAIGAAGTAGQQVMKTLAEERRLERAEDLAATKMGVTLASSLGKGGVPKSVDMGPALGADRKQLKNQEGKLLHKFNIYNPSGTVIKTFNAPPKQGMNIDLSGSKKFAELLSSQEGRNLGAALKDSRGAADKLPILLNMLSFVTDEDFESGKLQELLVPMKQLAYGLGIKIDETKLATQEAFVATAQQLVLGQVSQMKGALSDRELGFLQQQVASLGKSKRGNQLLLHLATHQMRKAAGFSQFYRDWKNQKGLRIGEKGTTVGDVADMYSDWRKSDIYKQSPANYVKSLSEKKEQEILERFGFPPTWDMTEAQQSKFENTLVNSYGDVLTPRDISEGDRGISLENYIGKELDRLYGVSLFNKIFKDYRSFGG